MVVYSSLTNILYQDWTVGWGFSYVSCCLAMNVFVEVRRKGLCFFEWNGKDQCMRGIGEDQIWSRKSQKIFTVVGQRDNNLRTFFFLCESCQIKSVAFSVIVHI